jgi:hypothetical protein
MSGKARSLSSSFCFKKAWSVRDGAQMKKNLLQRHINGEQRQRGRRIDARRIDEPIIPDDAIKVIVQKSLALRWGRRVYNHLTLRKRKYMGKNQPSNQDDRQGRPYPRQVAPRR